jgi:hypothetical protein
MILATLATLANMYKYAAPNVVAYSPVTEEVCSANPGNYWYMTNCDCLEDSFGHDMILACRIPEYFKPLEDAS